MARKFYVETPMNKLKKEDIVKIEDDKSTVGYFKVISESWLNDDGIRTVNTEIIDAQVNVYHRYGNNARQTYSEEEWDRLDMKYKYGSYKGGSRKKM